MELGLWVAAVILGLLFITAGTFKVVKSKVELVDNMAWVDDFSGGMVKFIGVAEVLGGIGLIAPAATGIATFLVPWAAVGLAVIMLGAAIVHSRRAENTLVGPNVMLMLLALFVAWGRFGPYAF